MSRRAIIIAILFAGSAAVYAETPQLPVALSVSRTLDSFRTPLSPARTSDRRVGSVDGVIWLVTPDGGVRRFLNGVSHGTEVSLPASLKTARAGSLEIAPVDRNTAWIVDRNAESFWRFAHGRWTGPFQTGEPIGSAAAWPGGSLAVNTPAHSAHAFSVIAPTGAIVMRFGERRFAPAAALDRYANSWVIATTSSGDVIAANAFSPLLRRYSASGKLVWEKRIALASLAPLDKAREAAEAAIRSNPRTCCIEAKLIHYASDVLITGHEIAVRYGFNAALEIFGDDGTWKGTVGVSVPPNPLGWPVAGLAVAGNGIAACELSRLVLYEEPRRIEEVRGSIVDPEGKAVAGAHVFLHASNGSRLVLTATAGGAFRIRGVPAQAPAEIRVAADGFLDGNRSGVLRELLASPIRLERQPRECVVVTDEAGAPVTKFRLEVGRLATGAETVTRGGGTALEFSSEDGKACLVAPVAPPLYVRVSAEGYATREVTVSQPGTAGVRLAPEARLQARIHDDANEPVADARLYVQPAATEKRAAFAIPDDRIATSDAGGIAKLKGLGADDYRVEVEHPSFLHFEKNIRIEKGPNDVDLRLDRGTELAVRVTSAGQRAADATVRAEGQGQSLSHPLHCTTGADGTCAIEGVAPGRYFIRAEAGGRSRGQQTVVVAPGDRSASVEIRLNGAVILTGRVRGVELYPETQLDLLVGKPGVPTIASPIARTGEFRIDEAPSGRVNVWVAEHGVNSTLLYRSAEIPDAPEYDLTIELPPPILVHGRITSSGAGCGSCRLTLQLLGSEIGRPLRSAEVRGDGSFVVRIPVEGSYRANASDPLSGASLVRMLEIRGDTNQDFVLGGSSLRVTVLDSAGDPAHAALVDVATNAGSVASLSTDAAGAAQFSALSAGSYRVTASLEGRAVSREIDIDGESSLELRLPDSAPLHLRIVDALSSLPMPMASAHVISARGEAATRLNLFGSDGIFTLPSFAAQPMTVVLSARGYALKTVRGVYSTGSPTTVVMTPGGRSFTVEIADTLQPCSFEVRDATGSAIALGPESNPGPVPLFVRNAVFYDLEPGTYTAVLYDCRGKAVAAPMRLAQWVTPALHFP